MATVGTRTRAIRVEDELWDAFLRAAKDSGVERSELLRQFMSWYIGKSDRLPQRPDSAP